MPALGDITPVGWRLRLLGGFRLEHNGRVASEFTRRRQDVLLAYLALHRHQVLSRAAVAQTIWPSMSRRLALNRLTEVLTLLRKQLRREGVPIELIDGGVQTFRLSKHVRTDVEDLEEAMARALVEKDPDRRSLLLEEVVDLHEAGLLPALENPWVLAERTRLEAARDHAAHLVVAGIKGGLGEAGLPETGVSAIEFARYMARGKRLQAAELASAHANPAPGPAWPEEVWPMEGGLAGDIFVMGEGRRLAHACLKLAELARPHLDGPERSKWLERLDHEQRHLTAALEWLLENEKGEQALRMTGALWRWWYYRPLLIDEGRVYLCKALELAPRPEGNYYAEAAMGAGGLAAHAGDLEVATRHYEDALAIYRDQKDFVGIARVLDDVGLVAHKQGEYERARRLYEESLAVARRLGDLRRVAAVLRNIALVELDAGRIEQAEEYITERVALARQIGDQRAVASALVSLARIVQPRDGWRTAKPHAEEAAALFEAEHDLRGVAMCLRLCGYGAQSEGNLAAAEAYYWSSLRMCKAIRDYWGVGEALRYLSAHAERAGKREEALEYAHQAEQVLLTTSDAPGAALARAQSVDLDATPGNAVVPLVVAEESRRPRPLTQR